MTGRDMGKSVKLANEPEERGAALLERAETLLYTLLFKSIENREWGEVREIEYHLSKLNLI